MDLARNYRDAHCLKRHRAKIALADTDGGNCWRRVDCLSREKMRPEDHLGSGSRIAAYALSQEPAQEIQAFCRFIDRAAFDRKGDIAIEGIKN